MKIDNKDQIVILAGGIAKRLGNLTIKKPKSLLTFNDKPFIFYQINLLKKMGFKNILILIGHKGQQIKKNLKNYNFSNLNIEFSDEGKRRLGTGGALKKAKKKLFDNFFLIYGDTYPQINFNLLKKNHFKKKLPYTIVVYKNMNKLDKSNIFIKKRKVVNYSKLSKKAQHIDYGVSLIKKDILENTKKNSFDLGIVTKLAISSNMLNYLIEKKRFYEIGSLKGINAFNKFLKKKMKKIQLFLNEIKLTTENIDQKQIYRLILELKNLQTKKGRLVIIGVGGSAANASHAVNDFRKLCNIDAYTPTDNVSELTARTNDEGWDTIFKGWLQTFRLNSKDKLLIFSVGGGNLNKNVSTNIIEAIKYAKKCKSKILSVVGKNDGYSYKNSDVCVFIPVSDKKKVTPISEAYQAVVWHLIVSHPILQKNKTKW